MLRKLLKYDMKAIFRVWWILAVATLVACFAGGFGFKIIEASSRLESSSVAASSLVLASGLFVFAGVMSLFASLIITFILIFNRFYKNFFTDEGYLTFTLPAKRSELFLSKTLNAIVWTFLQVAVFIIGFSLLTMFITNENDEFISLFILESFGGFFSTLFHEAGAWAIIYCVEGLIFVVFSMLFFVSLVHMCITVSAIIAKKHKVIAAFGIFYGVNTGLSLLNNLFGITALSGIWSGLEIITENASNETNFMLLALIFLIICAVMSTVAFLIYSITQRLLDRKLNLA